MKVNKKQKQRIKVYVVVGISLFVLALALVATASYQGQVSTAALSSTFFRVRVSPVKVYEGEKVTVTWAISRRNKKIYPLENISVCSVIGSKSTSCKVVVSSTKNDGLERIVVPVSPGTYRISLQALSVSGIPIAGVKIESNNFRVVSRVKPSSTPSKPPTIAPKPTNSSQPVCRAVFSSCLCGYKCLNSTPELDCARACPVSVGGTDIYKPTCGYENGQCVNLDKHNENPKEVLVGDYQWSNKTFQTLYSGSGIVWTKIVTKRLLGFLPKVSLIEKKSNKNDSGDYKSYIRMEGGMSRVGYWLEDSEGNKIQSVDKMIQKFTPVENEAEAMSFVAVTQSDLVIGENGVLLGRTLKIRGGFLVQLLRKNSFGCGRHIPTGIIYYVSDKGEIQTVAIEKEKPLDTKEPILCSD